MIRESNIKNPSKIAEFLNSVLLKKSNEFDLYDSIFSNPDTSVFSQRNNESTQDDRRKNNRFEIPLNAVVEDKQKNRYSLDLILNLSTSGARIASNNSLTTSDRIDLYILFPEFDDAFDIQGTVVWSRKEKDKNTEYGIKFDNIMQKINKVF
jgi:hypothetical protein